MPSQISRTRLKPDVLNFIASATERGEKLARRAAEPLLEQGRGEILLPICTTGQLRGDRLVYKRGAEEQKETASLLA